MWSLLLLGVSLGLLDSLNPFTISAQVVLQPFVKKTHHVLYYIVGTYLAYVIGGVFIYWGIDKVISAVWSRIMASHSALVFSLEVALGIAFVVLAFVFFFRQKKKKKTLEADQQADEKTPAAPKSVKPLFLFFFGAVNTVGDLPTAFPYLIFIAKIVDAKLPAWTALLFLALYCLIYILPLLIIYGLYALNKKRMEGFIEKLQAKVAAISQWAIIVLLAIIGLFFIIHGCIRLFS